MADSDHEDPTTISTRSTTISISDSKSNPTSSISTDPEIDPTEETPDFRLLSSLTPTHPHSSTQSSTQPPPQPPLEDPEANGSSSDSPNPLPRRGEKDFEPNPTRAQHDALAASRAAMHHVLSGERVHASSASAGSGGGGGVVGYLVRRHGLEGEDGAENLGRAGGVGVGGRGKFNGPVAVRVDEPRGGYFRTMGVSDQRNRVWLFPEEALYLLERGSLDVRWGARLEAEQGVEEEERRDGEQNDEEKGEEQDDKEKEDDEDEDEDESTALDDLPMSLQGAYATFITEGDLTLARYTVYAGLRRSGYTVVRAPTWNDDALDTSLSPKTQHEVKTSPTSLALTQISSISSAWRQLIARIFSYLFRSHTQRQSGFLPLRQNHARARLGPLVAPGIYRSYADIYRALTLIPFHDPLFRPPGPTPEATGTNPNKPSPRTAPPFRIAYHVYKPGTPYRKSAPPPPDFHLAVIDTAAHASIPRLTEIGNLLEEMPVHGDAADNGKAGKGSKPEFRLRQGTRSCVLAVVDCGVVSFLRVAETGSGRERIFEGRRGMGRGGKGGNRGRGRGGRGARGK